MSTSAKYPQEFSKMEEPELFGRKEPKDFLYTSPQKLFNKLNAGTPNDLLETRNLSNCFTPLRTTPFNRPANITSSFAFSPFTPLSRNYFSPGMESLGQMESKRILFTPSQYYWMLIA